MTNTRSSSGPMKALTRYYTVTYFHISVCFLPSLPPLSSSLLIFPPPPPSPPSVALSLCLYVSPLSLSPFLSPPLPYISPLHSPLLSSQMSRRENQYKLGSKPFPNPNSEDNKRKAHLRKIIEGAGDIRKGIDPSAAEEAKAKKPSRSKILKKPPQKLGSS